MVDGKRTRSLYYIVRGRGMQTTRRCGIVQHRRRRKDTQESGRSDSSSQKWSGHSFARCRCPQMTEEKRASERARNWQSGNVIIHPVCVVGRSDFHPKPSYLSLSLSVSFGDHCRPRSCVVPLFGRRAELHLLLLLLLLLFSFPFPDRLRRRHLQWASRSDGCVRCSSGRGSVTITIISGEIVGRRGGVMVGQRKRTRNGERGAISLSPYLYKSCQKHGP